MVNASLHNNGLRMNLLAATTISANVTVAGTPITGIGGMKYLVVEAVFLYGAGGGTVDAYIQTSVDAGASWLDIMNFRFTTAAATKVSAVVWSTALAAAVSPGDAALASNTILNGLLGDRLRLKYVTASTVYSGATSLAVFAIAKG